MCHGQVASTAPDGRRYMGNFVDGKCGERL